MYEISVDKNTNLVSAKLSGMMPVEAVAEFIAELKRQCLVNGLHGHGLLVDLRSFPVQTQSLVGEMNFLQNELPKASRIAFVTESQLARLQLLRLFEQPYARVVRTMQAGRDWVVHAKEPVWKRSEALATCA